MLKVGEGSEMSVKTFQLGISDKSTNSLYKMKDRETQSTFPYCICLEIFKIKVIVKMRKHN